MKETSEPKKILFISHEMSWTGAPRSLLRMCRAARDAGFAPVVWTMRPGPFEEAFAAAGIPVETIPDGAGDDPRRLRSIRGYAMAVCSTAVTAFYAKVCCQRIPTVWYIQEAANVSDVLATSLPETAFMLRHSRDVWCVSEYAARALAPYTDHPVRVLHNCVEDEALRAEHHVPGGGDRVRFLQLGTLEHRKGCDVLLDAFESLPPALRRRAEVYLAGPGSESDYGREILARIEAMPGARYLGVITDEGEKIRTLSRMDVAVVASRDEASSLVVLEGAMLGKPLIVTDHVGAGYMVGERNGYVAAAGDPESLRRAMERCIADPAALAPMGFESRRRYETMASMEKYARDVGELFALAEKRGTPAFWLERLRNVLVFRGKWKLEQGK